jgi:uncharacterized protein YhaN
MRIDKVSIGSFGGIRDRSFELGPGLNVFHGPNESGKTTVMEFIRSCLVPSNKRQLYPERSKRDEGSIGYTEGDESKSISLKGNGIDGQVPECLEHMDPAVYRSIFAMTSEGLDDIEPVSSGDIRNRFLSIPGGEQVPDLIKSIDQDISATLGKTASSPSLINEIQAREDRTFDSMGRLRQNAESYSELCERKAELEAELSTIRESNKEDEDANRQFARIESQRPAYESLARLKSSRDQLKGMKTVDRSEQREHDRLVTNAGEKSAIFAAADRSREEQQKKLGTTESKVRELKPRMEKVLSVSGEYERRVAEKDVEPPKKGKGHLVLAAILIVPIVAVFLVPGLDDIIRYCIAGGLAVAMAAIAILGGRSSRARPSSDSAWLQDYEEEVHSISDALGYDHSSIWNDLRRMSETLDVYTRLEAGKDEWARMQLDSMRAENDLLGFLSIYGGEEGYQKALKATADLSRINEKIDLISGSIKASGFDPDAPLPEARAVEIDRKRENEISSEIGALEVRMEAVLNTAELDALIDQSYMIKVQKADALRKGAVAMLSQQMVQDACVEMYRDVHPDVITTADRYLNMMTGGSYSFDLDPRNTAVTVRCDEGTKGPRQWSSGLRAQIMLSLKLAIAKEMGGGDVPVILDDVLLPFDSDRKTSAMEALAQLSSELQIHSFTCDDAVLRIAEGLQNTTIIRM